MSNSVNKFLFIIGSPKAGTTSLARWLGQRDDMVLGAEKEPRYFTDFAEYSWHGPGIDGFNATLLRNEAAYLNNFSNAKSGNSSAKDIWGIDASTDYLWCQKAAENIHEFSKAHPSKLICILRDPVDRSLSEYNHTLRDRMETLDLGGSLNQEQARMDAAWHPLFYHKRRSTCLADLERYHRLFGDDLLILGFHEFKDAEKLLNKVHDFLGLSGTVVAPSQVANRSTLPRNRFWNRLFGNEAARAVGRMIFPPAARSSIKQHTHKPAREMNTTNAADTDLLRQVLAGEIAACQDSPLVDTSHWTTARGA